MIKEDIPANSLNIRALVNKNPEVLAPCWYLEAPFIDFLSLHDLTCSNMKGGPITGKGQIFLAKQNSKGGMRCQ